MKIMFKWFDLWMGFYWDKTNRWLYVCPLPCVVFLFKFGRQDKRQDEVTELRAQRDAAVRRELSTRARYANMIKDGLMVKEMRSERDYEPIRVWSGTATVREDVAGRTFCMRYAIYPIVSSERFAAVMQPIVMRELLRQEYPSELENDGGLGAGRVPNDGRGESGAQGGQRS